MDSRPSQQWRGGCHKMRKAVSIGRALCAATLLLPLLAAWGCGHKADVTGNWEGLIDYGPPNGEFGKPQETSMHVVLNIRNEGEQLKAILTIKEERMTEPADTVEFKDNTLRLKIVSKREETYEAKLSGDGTELLGEMKQGPY